MSKAFDLIIGVLTALGIYQLTQRFRVKYINSLIESEVDAVSTLFRERLHYHVERYAIPNLQGRTKAQQELQFGISSFVRKYDDPNTLLIIYYNGHGSYW